MGLDPVAYGIIDNGKQTATILEGQRAMADNVINNNIRDVNKLTDSIEKNGHFYTQNLNQIGSTLRDVMERNGTASITAVEKTAKALSDSISDKTNLISHSIERIGGDNINATERVGALNLASTERNAGSLGIALERVGAAAVNTSERIGSTNGIAIERTNANMNMVGNSILGSIATGFKENMIETLRDSGENKLFVATQVQGLDKQIGSYFQQGQRDIGRLETDLSKVENSLGRVADNHYASSQIELLKATSMLDKNTDRVGADLARQGAENFAKTQLEMSKLELSMAKQAAENYAATQIEAAKNRMGIEQKILEVGNDVKTTLLKDGFDTKRLLEQRNTENLRDNLNTEKVIHGMHHHYGNHHGHHHWGHNRHHGHDWGYGEGPYIVNDLRQNYHNRNDDRRRRDDDDDRGGRGGRGGGD